MFYKLPNKKLNSLPNNYISMMMRLVWQNVRSFKGASHSKAWVNAILIVILVFWLCIIWLWPASILTLTVDDSYYYLKTAINVSQGLGFTFDGINLTNGFHPLWMFVLLPIGSLIHDNPDMSMRVILSLQLIMTILGINLLGKALEKKPSFLFAFILLLFNFYYAKIFINGLEACLQCLLICLTLAYWIWLTNKQNGSAILIFGLGLLAGLTFLSRLNTIFFIGPLFVLWTFFSINRTRNYVSCIYLLLGFLVFVVPYFCWNYLSYGHLMPVSGAIKMEKIRYIPMFVRLIALSLAASMFCWYCTLIKKSSTAYFLGPVVFYVILEVIYDVVLCGVLIQPIWYLVPEGILLIFLFEKLLLSRTLVASFLIITGVIWLFRFNPSSYSNYTAAYHAATWVSTHTAKTDIIAGWDSGITGMFSKRALVNLDGLINSWSYKENYLDKNAVNQFITDVVPVKYITQYFYSHTFSFTHPNFFYRGVDLSTWYIAYMDCFTFSSVLTPWKRIDRIYLILSRDKQELKFEDLFNNKAKEFC